MYMRLAGCVAGIVGVLGWEAATAAVHPTLDLKAEAPVEVDDPLVALSEGVVAARDHGGPVHHDPDRTWSFAVPHKPQPCSVAAVSCGQPVKEDAGVAPVSASPAACKASGPG